MIAAAHNLALWIIFIGLPVIALVAAIRLHHDDDEGDEGDSNRERHHG